MSRVLDEALYQQLLDYGPLTELLATALSVFREEAPPGAACPLVVFSKTTGTPEFTLAARWSNVELYSVRAITEGHSAVLAGSISEQIDAALEDAGFTVSGGTLIYCRRVEDVEYPEQAPGGRRFNHVGGVYRLQHT